MEEANEARAHTEEDHMDGIEEETREGKKEKKTGIHWKIMCMRRGRT